MRPMNRKTGFTLIEVTVILAIISLLASIMLINLVDAHRRSGVAKTQADLLEFRNVIYLFEADTNERPNHNPVDCTGDAEAYLNAASSGMETNDGGYAGWDGPYMRDVPDDIWGGRYIYDPDYVCDPGVTGCEGIASTTFVEAIHSGGPNRSGINVYDSDNIVLVLCGT